jgi:hypothetical protein
MDWTEILQNLFVVVIIPLLGLITKYMVQFFAVKNEELKEKTDNEIFKKYFDMLNKTVTNCVIATNQTYVDALKDKNAFTEEAQKEALQKTYSAIMAILSEDAKDYLSNATGDLQSYIMNLIEAQVKENKTPAK